jgi:hypothetical protein
MDRKATDSIVTAIGIDIGKNTFHLVGLDKRGAIVLRQKLSRGQVAARLANMAPCLVGMEACFGAHHLSRQLLAFGHDVKLVPGQFVKPFLKVRRTTSATPKPWLRQSSAPPCASYPPRVSTSSTCRRCIGFVRA